MCLILLEPLDPYPNQTYAYPVTKPYDEIYMLGETSTATAIVSLLAQI